MQRPLLPLLAALALAVPARAQRADAGLELLRAELARLTPISGGSMGVGVFHLESGRSLYLNGDEPFPMASTVKLPIAVQLFTLVDQAKLRLDSMVTVRPQDLHPGSGEISHLLNDPGVVLSVRNLMELMLLISDNSATDILLRVAGGGTAVNQRLRELGVAGISVDRATINLIADAIGVTQLPPEEEWTPEGFRTLRLQVTEERRKAAADSFYRDRRDTATPRGMAALLGKIWRGEALSRASTDLLLHIMYRCETGQARIKGFLPPDTPVAHKTGTLGIGVANDVGIVDLPGGAGHVIIVTFVKQSSRPAEAQERAIAQVSRAAHDYFVFNP
jgi:beta-lactamase class A